MPISELKFHGEGERAIMYSRLRQEFLIVRKPVDAGIPLPLVQFKVEKISGTDQRFGECSNYAIDNTGRFMTCVFTDTNQLIIINLKTLKIDYQVSNPEMDFSRTWLDETGCILATLNEKRQHVNIYLNDWEYNLKKTSKPTKIESALISKIKN